MSWSPGRNVARLAKLHPRKLAALAVLLVLAGTGRPAVSQVQPPEAPPAEDTEAEAPVPEPAHPVAKPNPRIQRAMDRAIAFLEQAPALPQMGYNAIGTAALLKSGARKDSPRIVQTLADIVAHTSSDKFEPSNAHYQNYEAAVCLMALAHADPQKYKRNITVLANHLIQAQGPAGDWDYPTRATGDTSISQYGVLGLWEAQRVGVRVPKKVWDRAAAWHVSRQLRNGSFTYHPTGSEQNGTHTMTMAGLGTLHICRRMLYPDSKDVHVPDEEDGHARKGRGKRFGVLLPPADVVENEADGPLAVVDTGPFTPTVRLEAIDNALGKALAWMEQNFAIKPQTEWHLYFIYGLERFGALSQLQRIAQMDWYEAGAEHLMATQLENGSWIDAAGPVPSTAFGLLFLSRATAKMVKPHVRIARLSSGILAGGRGLPKNLDQAQLDHGEVKVRKLEGSVVDLLSELEKGDAASIEAAQAGLVDEVMLEDPLALVGKRDQILNMLKSKRAEVRQTAYWALGRSDDITLCPTLIQGFDDPDNLCVIEAHEALRFLSKKLTEIPLPAEPTREQIKAVKARWQAWYLTIRPYDERDDLLGK